MKTFAVMILASALNSAASAATINFDDAKPGSLPAHWKSTQTGNGEAKWAVVADDTAPSRPNVFKQSGEATYPVALKTDTRLKDGFVEVKFKPVSGKEDQAGGVIWRAQDANNYYVARANALEDNVRIYHVKDGKRVQFKGADLKVQSHRWHTLRVEFAGRHFKVIFNGQLLYDAEDGTFAEAGQVGLWTKADSVTLFDDFAFGGR